MLSDYPFLLPPEKGPFCSEATVEQGSDFPWKAEPRRGQG